MVGRGVIVAKLMERLGIAEKLKDRTKLVDGVPVAEVVAKGEAEIGIQQINVILPVAGADDVGPLPAELQGYVYFAVGVLAVSSSPTPRRSGQVHVVVRGRAPHPQERHGAAAALTGICQAKWRKGGIALKPRKAHHSVRVHLPGHLIAPVAEVVAKGEAEIGIQQINVILPVAGADDVGPLPAELQGYVYFAVGVLAVSWSNSPALFHYEQFSKAGRRVTRVAIVGPPLRAHFASAAAPPTPEKSLCAAAIIRDRGDLLEFVRVCLEQGCATQAQMWPLNSGAWLRNIGTDWEVGRQQLPAYRRRVD